MHSRPSRIPLAAATLLCALAACNLVIDVDGLEDQHCRAGEKVCGTTCVPNDDPSLGCNEPGCSPCAPPHAIGICGQNLQCFFTRDNCLPGWDDCDGKATNGCETDLAHDRDHCGGCNAIPCVKPPNGIAGCSAGVCGLGGCNPGWANCNNEDLLRDGCETPLGMPPHCLGCNIPCLEETTCDEGACEPMSTM